MVGLTLAAEFEVRENTYLRCENDRLRAEVERKDAYVAELVGACEVAFEVLEACVKPLGGCDDRAAISDAKDRLRTALDHTEAAAHTATEKNP